jgi:hypothetical protein
MDEVQHFKWKISQDSNLSFPIQYSLSNLLFVTDGRLKYSETLPTVKQGYGVNVPLTF